MKLSVVRVLPLVFALLMPTTALAEVSADAAPMGRAAAAHADRKGGAKGRAKPAKKPKAKAKAKRAKTPGKATKAKSGKKAAPRG